MDHRRGMPPVQWVIVLFCLACVAFGAWRVFDSWRGPAPAVVDPNSDVGSRWGRPVPQRLHGAEADSPQ
jgi:hypothetical protein